MVDTPWLERMKKSFNYLDLDHDGLITESELSGLASLLNERLTPNELKGMIAQIDSNKDGKIDFEEFRRVTEGYFKMAG